MQRTLTFSTILLYLALSPAVATAAIYIEYDRNVDFSKYETWNFEESEMSIGEQVPRMDARIKSQIADTLMKRGRRPSGGDLVVTYHLVTKENTQVNTMYLSGYGYGAGWGAGYYAPGYGSGWNTSVSSLSTYTTGTFVVDVYDAKSKELIWRGTATDISPIAEPDKARAKVDQVMKKLASKWEKMKKEDGIKTRD